MSNHSPATQRVLTALMVAILLASLLPQGQTPAAAQGGYLIYLPQVASSEENAEALRKKTPTFTPTATQLPATATSAAPTATAAAPSATAPAAATATRLPATPTAAAPTATSLPPTATQAAPTATAPIAPTATRPPATATLPAPTPTAVSNPGVSPDSSALRSPRPVLPTGGAVYYAAPNGTSSGDGTSGRPWDIQTALNHPSKVLPGDTIYLRGGRYGSGSATRYTSRLAGLDGKPIVVRQYPGERAIVDGGILAEGQWTWFWGFEITNSLVDRTTDATNHPPGLYLNGRGHKAINLLVYNTGHPGIGFWSPVGDGGEIYGCIIYGVGTYDTDREGVTRGSAIYAQNIDGTRYIRDVISFRNFKTGMKAYTEADYVNGFLFEGNISFENGDRLIFISGRDHPAERLKMYNNYTYRTPDDSDAPVRLGYPDLDQIDATVQGNWFVNGTHTDGAFWIKRFRTFNVTGNVFVSPNMLATYIKPTGAGTRVWDNNKYYDGGSSPFRIDTTQMTWSTWRSTSGFDANSTFSTSRPSGLNWFLRPNLYEPNRANIAVYNWSKAGSVTLNLSSFLTPGQSFEIRDAQNFNGAPVVSGVYTGAGVTVPMNLTAVAPITGTLPFSNVHTSAEFGAFVIIRK